MNNTPDQMHWTRKSIAEEAAFLSYDFVDQLTLPFHDSAFRQVDLASKLNVTEGRVSQLFNRPGNLTLRSLVYWAKPLALDVSVVVYPQADPAFGPISGEVFRRCWEALGEPRDLSAVDERSGAGAR